MAESKQPWSVGKTFLKSSNVSKVRPWLSSHPWVLPVLELCDLYEDRG